MWSEKKLYHMVWQRRMLFLFCKYAPIPALMNGLLFQPFQYAFFYNIFIIPLYIDGFQPPLQILLFISRYMCNFFCGFKVAFFSSPSSLKTLAAPEKRRTLPF